jgi:oxygen-dependent protoporphyrinogen oxidase
LAFRLKKAGFEPVILEKEGRTGGVINTLNKGDFVFETGPNTGIIANSDIVQLFEDLGDKIEVEHAGAVLGQRLIFKNNRWIPLPSGLISGISTPLFTFSDKIRLLGEPFRKKGSDPDETLASLVLRRMGRSFLNYAVDPFVSGVYAGDANSLVTRYAFPKLYNLEQDYGSFIKGAVIKGLKSKTEAEKKVTRKVFSRKGGRKSLTDALSDATGYEKSG